jgi:hypothetical protein
MPALVVKREDAVRLFDAIGFPKPEKWDDERLIEKLEDMERIIEDEGDDMPPMKGDNKKLMDSLLKAIGDDDEIKLAGDITNASDDEDEDRGRGRRRDRDEDEDRPRPSRRDEDDDRPPRAANRVDDDDDRRPPARTRAGKAEKGPEEFVGIRELVSVLTVIAGLFRTMLGSKAPGDSDDDEPAPRRRRAQSETEPSSNGSGTVKDIIAEIRRFVGEATEDDPVSESEIMAHLKDKYPDADKDKTRKRLDTQLKYAMSDDGIGLKKKDGKYYVAASDARPARDDDDD